MQRRRSIIAQKVKALKELLPGTLKVMRILFASLIVCRVASRSGINNGKGYKSAFGKLF